TLKPADKTTCQKWVRHGCPDYTLFCDLFETNLATGQHAASSTATVSTATVSTATALIATPLQVKPQEDENLYDSDCLMTILVPCLHYHLKLPVWLHSYLYN
ncbi:UNVERIFIED_CONTAM: hypothetical protein HDU68_002895, partial [Siphonaria sp. JEL0065]